MPPAVVMRVALAGIWIGLIGALSFIETPLKFLAPDVTLPIALGIGRLVLTAANLAGAALLAVLAALSFVRPRLRRGGWWVLIGLTVVLLTQIAIIRPPLNARTDIILAGGDPGSSPLHVLYVVADALLMLLLVAYIVLSGTSRATDGAARTR
ncbi:hypothetical protein M4I32_03690 [Microbacterium sp. LRZ72]|uniref:hypothetical protein n=1 Tax=Microbacterium sp. LRZ72 TaxID=2942481 RepID=UPI0029B80420|nr:hypothetical protein [Microbacterium sp. LRZ72]MDX2375899.1 hypothetical protein [Microbacterium sp. LRZ72]